MKLSCSPILELICIFVNSDHKKPNFQFLVSFLPIVILWYELIQAVSSRGGAVSQSVVKEIVKGNAIDKGINGLPSLDLFKDIDPLVDNENLMNMITRDARRNGAILHMTQVVWMTDSIA